MYFLKPRSILGQALTIICFLVSLAVVAPWSARSDPESGRFDYLLRGKTTLAWIKIDTASQFVGKLVEIPILIRNDLEFGSFELQVDFPHQYLNFVGAERGEALSDTTDGTYDWEYFTYRLLPLDDTLYGCQIYGLCDIPDGHQGVPLDPNSEYISLVVMKFVIAEGEFPLGTFLPIIFEWEVGDCLENTFLNPPLDTLYVSQDSLQFNTTDCPPESVEYLPLSPSLEFFDGGVYAYYASGKTGDVNLNWISYEIADWVLFQSFLLYGDSLLIYPEQQAANSDVNCDGLPWSIADLLYMCRVILHDAVEIPCKDQESSLQEYSSDEFVFISSSAYPGDVVSVPIWLSNSLPSRGVTFKLVFDESLLSVGGVDTSQGRISGWADIYPVINPGELFFFTYGDWWNEHYLSYSSIEPGAGNLVGVNFKVDENAPAETFIPVVFEIQEDLGHYNSYTDTGGLVLVQPATMDGWIFTEMITGDANSDGIVDSEDLVYLIDYLFRAGFPPSPSALGDATCDGVVDVDDVVFLVNYIYRGGPPPGC